MPRPTADRILPAPHPVTCPNCAGDATDEHCFLRFEACPACGLPHEPDGSHRCETSGERRDRRGAGVEER